VAELLDSAARVVLIAPFPGALNSPLGQRLRADPRVELLEGYHVAEVESSAGAVHAIQVARNGQVQRVPVQAVFVDLGLVPSSQMVRQLVELDERGFIVVDDQQQASLPGLFAAGDVTTMICEQILIAIGAGARAAQSAYAYILAERLGQQSRSVGTQGR
jgi:alkyl hydroperoxide reductase subunit AhpF